MRAVGPKNAFFFAVEFIMTVQGYSRPFISASIESVYATLNLFTFVRINHIRNPLLKSTQPFVPPG